MTEILTADELAKMLKVDVQTIRRLIKSGDLQGFKVGSEYRFTGRDVEAFIEGNRVKQEVKA